MTSQRGFTLIELLITVAIVSIMMAIGLPSFQSLIASNRLTSAANAMVSALQLARMEALKQHKAVVVTKNTSWANGWIVFVDSNSNSTQDASDSTENTFATFDALKVTTITPTTGYTNTVIYNANGRVNTSGNFAFCSAVAIADFRTVVIAVTGRIHIETANNSTRTYASECPP
jgi:type IV fimbrial biogenesis protein FimT